MTTLHTKADDRGDLLVKVMAPMDSDHGQDTDENIDIEGRRARYRMSAFSVDRMGEVLVPEGCDLTTFLTNPVALYRHNGEQLPVGAWEDVEIVPSDGVYGWCRFGTTSHAEDVWTLVREKILRGVSVGFYAREVSPQPVLPGQTGATIKRWEMVECSPCPDPCNTDALMLAVKAGVSQSVIADYWPEETKALQQDRERYSDARMAGNCRRAKGAIEGVLNHLRHLAKQHKSVPEPQRKAFDVTATVWGADLEAAIGAARQLGEIWSVNWTDDYWAELLLGERPAPVSSEPVQCGHCGGVWCGPCHCCPECGHSDCPHCGYCSCCNRVTSGGMDGVVPPPMCCQVCDCIHAAETAMCPECQGQSCPDCGHCATCGEATSDGNQPGGAGPLPVGCPACGQSWCGTCACCPECKANTCPACGYCTTCGRATGAVLAPAHMHTRHMVVVERRCPDCERAAETRTPPPEPHQDGAPSDETRETPEQLVGLTADELPAVVARIVEQRVTALRKAAIGGPVS